MTITIVDWDFDFHNEDLASFFADFYDLLQCGQPDSELTENFLRIIEKNPKFYVWARLIRKQKLTMKELEKEFTSLVENWPAKDKGSQQEVNPTIPQVLLAPAVIPGPSEPPIKLILKAGVDPSTITRKEFFKAAASAGLRVCTKHNQYGHFTSECKLNVKVEPEVDLVRLLGFDCFP